MPCLANLTIRAAVVLSAMFGAVAAQELQEVAHAYLQRHGVPCRFVIAVDRPVREFDLVATCDDGRQWALFMIEGEVAFVQPEDGEPYRWQPEVYRSYPELYGNGQPRDAAADSLRRGNATLTGK